MSGCAVFDPFSRLGDVSSRETAPSVTLCGLTLVGLRRRVRKTSRHACCVARCERYSADEFYSPLSSLTRVSRVQTKRNLYHIRDRIRLRRVAGQFPVPHSRPSRVFLLCQRTAVSVRARVCGARRVSAAAACAVHARRPWFAMVRSAMLSDLQKPNP